MNPAARGVVLSAALLLAGCAQYYGAARDAIASMQSAGEGALRQKALETLLEQRFRPELAQAFGTSAVGHVVCPAAPDMEGYAVTYCTLDAGNGAMPILAQLNATDDHLNSALGFALLSRSQLERHAAADIAVDYGVQTRASCTVARVVAPAPGFQTACAVTGASKISRVTLYVLDTNAWIETVASTEPFDERSLDRARTAADHRVSGKLVAALISNRENALSRVTGSGHLVSDVACPDTLDLSGGRIARCSAEFDGQRAEERVMFAHNRLTYQVEGAVIDVEAAKKSYEAQLRRRFDAGPGVRIDIECGSARLLIITGLGYHWCEIHAPPGYPRRLAFAELDREGHYDGFFTNFSQAARDH